MKLVITGTQAELHEFFKGFGSDANLKELLDSGLIETDTKPVDNEDVYDVLQEVSWDSRWLLVLILKMGQRLNQRDSAGVYLADVQLEKYGKIGDRQAAARVGAFEKVASRLEVDKPIFIKSRKDQKRYYLSEDAMSTVQQFLDRNEEEYKEYLEDHQLDEPNKITIRTKGVVRGK